MQLEVRTALGRLQGAAEGDVRVWKGVPYAAPPVGPLRWRAPRPPAAWREARTALRFGPDAPQAPNAGSRAPAMAEDCLYLNIWAPAEAAPGSMPVMVWLHGGGFVGGSGADARCDGAQLARHGVVVVSFNYRVGLLGYLAHPALSAETPQGSSGNYGLLDQIAALRWVQAHIAAFGGNPRQVTAFGVSAGSASIAAMLAMPSAGGLFQRAILHSPGTARPLASLAEAEAAGAALGADLAALRALPVEQLLAAAARLNPPVRSLTAPRLLRPIRDGWLLPEDERTAFLAGRLHRMPLIVGTNLDEGSLLTRSWPLADAAAARALIEADFGPAAAEALRWWGPGPDGEARNGIAQAFADTQFNHGARLLLRAMSAQGSACWRYLFRRCRPGRSDGPHHAEEVGYVFGRLDAPGRAGPEPFDDTDRALSQAMMKAWVAFAGQADPNVDGLPYWPRYRQGEEHQLEFGDRICPGTDARRAQLDFLDRCLVGLPPAA